MTTSSARAHSMYITCRYVDLVNHQSYVGSEYGIDTYVKGWYQCLSSEAYEAGAEIFISYGSHHHTAHFLETYGFAPGGFEHMDTIGFHLTPKNETARKCAGGKHAEYCKGDVVAVAGIDGCIRQGRVGSFERTVASVIADKSVQRITDAEITTTRAYMREQITRELAGFSTTYESDINRLVSGESLSFDDYVVLAVRSRYKRVLHAVAEQLGKNTKCEEKVWLHSREIADKAAKVPGAGTDGWLYKFVLTLP